MEFPKLLKFQPLYQRKKLSRKSCDLTRKKYEGQTTCSENSEEARRSERRVVGKVGFELIVNNGGIGVSKEREA